MKRLLAEAGGRPRANDDLTALQELILTGSGSPLLKDFPTCVVSGCTVSAGLGGIGGGGATTYTVSAGVVLIGGQLYDFPGSSAASLPATFALGSAVAIDQRPYQTGGTKTCISDTKAVLQEAIGGAVVAVDAQGPIMWYDHLANKTRTIGLIEFGAFDLTGFDLSTGLGVGRNRGWAMADGRNNTLNFCGRTPVGLDRSRSDYDVVGDMGGAEQVTLDITQMPAHRHTMASAGAHSHRLLSNVDSTGNGAFNFQNVTRAGNNGAMGEYNTRSSSEGDHIHVINDTGGGQPFDNRMPFMAVVARQWLGL